MKKITLTTRISAGAKRTLDNTKKKTGLSKEQIVERCIKAQASEIIRRVNQI